MRIILIISQIHRGKIILFSKGCPNPSFPLYAATAPTQAATALARWQSPCQGAATPVASAAALAGGRVGRGRQPLAGALQPAPFAGTALQAAMPAGGASAPTGGYRPLRAPLASLLGWPWPQPTPPYRGPWPRPGRGLPVLHGG
ncbi:hypothetical protein BHE74_00039607 [Ensete ventricosum]|nr:hypothetical protein BHE74_00039607 [Ensete ventricosum]